MAAHWHAYSWTGHERPADSERINTASATPPLETAHWLLKSRQHVVDTFDIETGADQAYAWLEGELKQNERGPHDLAPEAQLAHARDCLDRGADVVWGYYSERGRYVSRTLVACPLDGYSCPAPQ